VIKIEENSIKTHGPTRTPRHMILGWFKKIDVISTI